MNLAFPQLPHLGSQLILPVVQAKNPGVIPDSSLSHTQHPTHQQILLALTSKEVQDLTTSQHCTLVRATTTSCLEDCTS